MAAWCHHTYSSVFIQYVGLATKGCWKQNYHQGTLFSPPHPPHHCTSSSPSCPPHHCTSPFPFFPPHQIPEHLGVTTNRSCHGGCPEHSWRQTCTTSAELASHFLDTWWVPNCPPGSHFETLTDGPSQIRVLGIVVSHLLYLWLLVLKKIMKNNVNGHIYPFISSTTHPSQAELTLW